MSTNFERLKQISTPIKQLVNGYIRQCQDELFGEMAADNPYYNIPQLINNHCILFYDTFAWYRGKHGDDLEFISDTEVTMYDGTPNSLCMFENVISSAFCDRFEITFKTKGKFLTLS